MENASKALIIAGAILISILLIAISMVVYNAGKSAVDTAADQMSSTEIQMYNSSITTYVGDSVKAASVKGCIDAIVTSNANCAGQSGKFIGLKLTASGVTSFTASNSTSTSVNGTTVTIACTTAGANTNSYVSGSGADMSTAKTFINSGKKYTISVEYSSAGLVNNVIIDENS